MYTYRLTPEDMNIQRKLKTPVIKSVAADSADYCTIRARYNMRRADMTRLSFIEIEQCRQYQFPKHCQPKPAEMSNREKIHPDDVVATCDVGIAYVQMERTGWSANILLFEYGEYPEMTIKKGTYASQGQAAHVASTTLGSHQLAADICQDC